MNFNFCNCENYKNTKNLNQENYKIDLEKKYDLPIITDKIYKLKKSKINRLIDHQKRNNHLIIDDETIKYIENIFCYLEYCIIFIEDNTENVISDKLSISEKIINMIDSEIKNIMTLLYYLDDKTLVSDFINNYNMLMVETYPYNIKCRSCQVFNINSSKTKHCKLN